MAKRLRTGVPGLDTILGGGLLYHNSVLLRGQPGAGKTTLGIQIIHNGVVEDDEPGLIVLFEQFPQQLFRDLASYHWDIEALAKTGRLEVLFAQPDDLVGVESIADSLLVSKICEAADRLGARRVLIDGLSQMISIAGKNTGERELYLRFLNSVKSVGLTPLLTAEGADDNAPAGYEEYLTDCVIHLSNRALADPTFQMRWLEIRKTRGHGHVRGKHPYRISDKGIEVFPRLPPAAYDATPPDSPALERATSGIHGLDELMGGGYTRGASVSIAGVPGAFKTTLGVQFLTAGAANGEPGLLIGFNESPGFLMKTMAARGLALDDAVRDGKTRIWHRFPKHFYVEELLAQLETELAAGRARRVVVDGLNEFERSIDDPALRVDMLSKMVALLNRREATSLFIQNVEDFTANAPLTDVIYADVFDGIVYTGTIEIESAVHKVISVLKMRGSSYLTDLREITCGQNGLEVREKFVGLSGILAGAAQGHYKQTVEEIFQPLYFVRDFLQVLASPEVTDDQRKGITDDLTAQVSALEERLREYFEIPDNGD